MIAIAVAVLLVFGILLGVYAVIAPRRSAGEPTILDRIAREPLHATTEWTSEAGQEFSNLSEPARCDLIFAVAALHDERSAQLLKFALFDPSETVAVAAAHALVSSGRAAAVDRFLAEHPGERTDRIARMLTLLKPKESKEAVAAGR
jgi:hypothetical protein